MSVRSTLLNTARVARQALPRAQIAPRRAASTGAHKSSSNTPWAIGSAAVFGSLAAFILTSGDSAAHAVHENIDAKGAGAHVADGSSKPEHEDEAQANARELMRKERDAGERPTVNKDYKDKPVHAGEDRPRTEIPSKRDDDKPAKRGPSTGDRFDGATVDGKHNVAGEARKSDDGEKSSESKSDDSDKSDKPSVDAIKESVKKAEEAAVPRVAMDKEASGSSKSTSSSSTPDNVDDSNAPSDSEIKDSIKQAERSNSPLATMDEEVKESGNRI